MKKKMDKEDEEMRRLLKVEERLEGVGFGSGESEDTLRIMTYEQIRGLCLLSRET